MTKVLFWIALQIPGQPMPATFEHQVESLAACLFEVHQFLTKPPHELLLRGGKLSSGCLIEFLPSEEH